MNFRKRKTEIPGDTGASADVPQQETASTGETSSSAVERISTYVLSKNDDAASEGAADVQPGYREGEPVAAQAEAAVDVASIGDEVGTVLKSAREAAGRIRQAADEEARRVRTEAQSAAAAEIAEARRFAENERAEAARIRTEAEAEAEDARAAAHAFAEQRRAEASQEAEQLVAEAARRRDAAEAEVEQKLREATANQREHIRALQAEIERHEKRLESILAVFRGMTAQLEGVLERRRDDAQQGVAVSDEVVESSDELEAALRPDSAGSRTG